VAAVELSVVVPVYGCEGCLYALHERLTQTLVGLGAEYELVFVDDGSVDRGWDVMTDIAARDPRLHAIKLSRNFGQHAAITAGIAEAGGNWIVVMDCDLQDPPEEIPRLYAKAQEGYDIVLGRRAGRQHTLFRRLASAMYFRVLNRLAGTRFDSGIGNFSIISEQVRGEFLRFRDKDRHYLMILAWLGFSEARLDFQHADRYAGRSAYTLASLVRFAFEGLFFQTTTLLRWIVYVGFGVSSSGVVLAVYFVVRWFLGVAYPGWTSLAVLQLLVGGFIIVSTGVAGLYVGKIFNQVKDRPVYIIDEVYRSQTSVVGEDDVRDRLLSS